MNVLGFVQLLRAAGMPMDSDHLLLPNLELLAQLVPRRAALRGRGASGPLARPRPPAAWQAGRLARA
jgi:hypothetical protein